MMPEREWTPHDAGIFTELLFEVWPKLKGNNTRQLWLERLRALPPDIATQALKDEKANREKMTPPAVGEVLKRGWNLWRKQGNNSKPSESSDIPPHVIERLAPDVRKIYEGRNRGEPVMALILALSDNQVNREVKQ